MKIVKIFILAFFGITAVLNAQDIVKEGYLKMELKDVKADDEQMQMMVKQMMQNSVYEFYFSEKQTLAVIDMMGGMMNIKTLANNESKDVEMLMDAMGQKSHVSSTEKERGAKSIDASKVKIEVDKSDTKEILGFVCHKTNISIPNQMSISAYLTEDLKLSNSAIQGMEGIDLPGFPLEYTLDVNGMKLTIAGVKLDKEYDKDVFNLNTEGYKKMTFEEFNQSMGKMAGGLGF